MPIIVTGTGRSGTTAVARELEQLGFNMGNQFSEFYEDLEFRDLNKDFIDGKVGKKPFEWGVRRLLLQRREPWGLKDPHIADLWQWYWFMVPEGTIWIVCDRDPKAVVLSYLRRWPNLGEGAAIETVGRRHANLEGLRPFAHVLNFDNWVEPATLRRFLVDHVLDGHPPAVVESVGQ